MRIVAPGAELCVQTSGSPGDPAVLLIAGAASSMDWWEEEFCARLVAGGRYVVRYDHRDTGTSTTWPAGEPGYTGADLVADALTVLDTLGITRARRRHLDGRRRGPAGVRVSAITAPTLVLHGTEDPLFPIGHGEALAAEIPGARLVPLPGVGHQMPPPAVWDVVVPEILAHSAGP